MDELSLIGVRIDDDEHFRILSAEAEVGARELSAKINSLLDNLHELNGRLQKAQALLDEYDKQTKRVQLLSIAANIMQSSNKQGNNKTE